MATARGILTQFGLDYETTFGADPGAPDGILMYCNSFGVEASRPLGVPGTLLGIRDPEQPFVQNTDVGGAIAVPIDFTAFWYWMKACFGDPSTAGAGDPYTHTFTTGDSQPSMVLEKGFTDNSDYWKYNGCKVASWNMTLGGDGELLSTFNIMGASRTLGTSAYDATLTDPGFNRLNNFQVSAITEGGGATTELITLDLTVDFGLDGDVRVIGGAGKRADIPEGMISVTGNITALFQDNTLATKGDTPTESSLSFTVTSGTHSFAVTIPELYYELFGTPIEGPQGVRQSAAFRGFYNNDGDASVITAVLVNADAHA